MRTALTRTGATGTTRHHGAAAHPTAHSTARTDGLPGDDLLRALRTHERSARGSRTHASRCGRSSSSSAGGGDAFGPCSSRIHASLEGERGGRPPAPSGRGQTSRTPSGARRHGQPVAVRIGAVPNGCPNSAGLAPLRALHRPRRRTRPTRSLIRSTRNALRHVAHSVRPARRRLPVRLPCPRVGLKVRQELHRHSRTLRLRQMAALTARSAPRAPCRVHWVGTTPARFRRLAV